jgi:hypothetical protein
MSSKIWYLLVDRDNPNNVTQVHVSAHTDVEDFTKKVKANHPNSLADVQPEFLEVWKWNHPHLSAMTQYEEIAEIIGSMEFSEDNDDLECLAAGQKVMELDLPDYAILLVTVSPLWKAKPDPANDRYGEYFKCLLQLPQLSLADEHVPNMQNTEMGSTLTFPKNTKTFSSTWTSGRASRRMTSA